MTSWNDDDTDAVGVDLVVAWERAELAARWMLRNGPPSPEHYRAVMDALDATERTDATEAAA